MMMDGLRMPARGQSADAPCLRLKASASASKESDGSFLLSSLSSYCGNAIETSTVSSVQFFGKGKQESMATINYELRISEVPPGSALLVGDVAVFNVGGSFCAAQDKCTHRQGPLSQGKLDGSSVTCPYHGAQFNVCTGAVLRGPARDSLKTYRVIVDGAIGRIETSQVQQSEIAKPA